MKKKNRKRRKKLPRKRDVREEEEHGSIFFQDMKRLGLDPYRAVEDWT